MERMKAHGKDPVIKVGRNSSLPFKDGFFDYLLACHSCYYLDDNETMQDNLLEYSRVLKPGGYFVGSVIHAKSYLLVDSELLLDGSSVVKNDPYGNRNGYRLHGFNNECAIKEMFSKYFSEFSIGQAHNDYYGIDENVFWVVCRKPA